MRRKKGRLVILADTREQLPFVFPGHTVRRSKLETGDYTLHGYKDLVSVERKGFGDFLACISAKWEKFMAPGGQVDRLHALDFSLLVVEGTVRKARSSCYSHYRMAERVIISRLAEVSMWIPVLLCDNRIMARDATIDFLSKSKEMIDQ